VLSQGVRESIETVFEKYGIEGVEYHANAFTGDDGTLALSYPEYRTIDDGCNDLCGVCKGGHIRAARRSGFTTVYIGDGITDRCAAANADIVFATKYLREYLEKEGREHIAFDSFDEILSKLPALFP
jgi:2-hydroxy-3-keto-5-methylthiopentenyl-1-phosphate phosphatase